MVSVIDRQWLLGGMSAFIVADLVFLVAFLFPSIAWALLPVIIIAYVFLVIRIPVLALLIPLAELAWGSFGSALSWPLTGFSLSLRMLLFAETILLTPFIIGRLRPMRLQWKHPYILVGLGLAAAAAWGIVSGLLHGVSYRLIFEDANAFVFLAYVPIWMLVVRPDDGKKAVSLIAAAAAVLAGKTLLFFHLFAFQYEGANIPLLYIWVRDTRMGEITPVTETVWRIFFQSQFYVSVAYLWHVLYRFGSRGLIVSWGQRALGIVLFIGVALSLSRSFWLGLIVTLGIALVFSLQKLWPRRRELVKAFGSLAFEAVLAGGIIFLASGALFGARDVSGAFLRRLADSTTDAAGASRVEQIQPLIQTAMIHPFTGNGFGTEVTYESHDPRYRNPLNPTGSITTYAFELGYLDLWVKIGIIALVLFVGALCYFLSRGFRQLRVIPDPAIAYGLLAAVVYSMVVHAVSPYLNHPLGLGIVMLALAYLYSYTTTSHAESNNQSDHVQ